MFVGVSMRLFLRKFAGVSMRLLQIVRWSFDEIIADSSLEFDEIISNLMEFR